LSPTPEQTQYLEQTEKMYRSYARALIGVVFTHFPQVASADSPCATIEKLIHKTTKNPTHAIATSARFTNFLLTCVAL
jgi:hypothetical protein